MPRLKAATASNAYFERSHGKEGLDVVLVHVAPQAALDDFTARHDQIVIRERAREVIVLLDQQNGDLALACDLADRLADFIGFRKPTDCAFDVLDDRRLYAFGRLIEYEQLRVHG